MNFTKQHFKELTQLITSLLLALQTRTPDMEQGIALEKYLDSLKRQLNND